MTTSQNLAAVRRAARRRVSAEQSFREVVIRAHTEGASLRAIAKVADLSHVRILQIVRGE